MVPAHVSQRIYDAVQEPKALWLLPGGNHQFAQHDPGINQRVLNWLAMSRPSTEELKIEDVPED